MTGILSPHVLLLELDDYGEETKRVFISANNYGERCLRSYYIQGFDDHGHANQNGSYFIAKVKSLIA